MVKSVKIMWENPEGYQPGDIDSFCAKADTIPGLIGASGLTTYAAFQRNVLALARARKATKVRIMARSQSDVITVRV